MLFLNMLESNKKLYKPSFFNRTMIKITKFRGYTTDTGKILGNTNAGNPVDLFYFHPTPETEEALFISYGEQKHVRGIIGRKRGLEYIQPTVSGKDGNLIPNETFYIAKCFASNTPPSNNKPCYFEKKQEFQIKEENANEIIQLGKAEHALVNLLLEVAEKNLE
jgi:hypothetical protein